MSNLIPIIIVTFIIGGLILIAALRDVRNGPPSALGWAIFNLFALASVTALIWGLAGLSIAALFATVIILSLFFYGT